MFLKVDQMQEGTYRVSGESRLFPGKAEAGLDSAQPLVVSLTTAAAEGRFLVSLTVPPS